MPLLERQDFTGGLWERENDHDIPENGLLTLTDAYPLEQGGVRAAFTWTNHTPTNLPTSGNKIFHGFKVFDVEGGGAIGYGYDFLAAWGNDEDTGHDVEIRTIKNTVTPDGTFELVRTHNSQPRHIIDFAEYVRSTDFLRNLYYSIRSGTSPGVWRYVPATPTSTAITTNASAHLFSHQDRLVYLERISRPRFRFTDPGTETFGSDSWFEVAPSYTSEFAFALPGFPGDLYVMKQNDGMFVVQGDPADPAISESPGIAAPNAVTRPIHTPHGFFYLTQSEGVHVWAGAGSKPLSNALIGSRMTEVIWRQLSTWAQTFVGNVGYGHHFIITPKGYCMDLRTGAWFQTTFPHSDAVVPFFQYDFRRNRMICGASTGSAGSRVPKIYSSIWQEDSMNRASTYSLTWGPIHVDRRRIHIREVELHFHNYASGSTITALLTPYDGGSTQTKTTVAQTNIGPSVARLDFSRVGDVFKLKLTSASNGSGEAPAIKRIVVRYEEKTRFPE